MYVVQCRVSCYYLQCSSKKTIRRNNDDGSCVIVANVWLRKLRTKHALMCREHCTAVFRFGCSLYGSLISCCHFAPGSWRGVGEVFHQDFFCFFYVIVFAVQYEDSNRIRPLSSCFFVCTWPFGCISGGGAGSGGFNEGRPHRYSGLAKQILCACSFPFGERLSCNGWP